MDRKTLLKEIIDNYARLSKNEKLVAENANLQLPTLTPSNISFHILDSFLIPYEKQNVILCNRWFDRLNHLIMFELFSSEKENFCCVTIAKFKCDTKKKIWVFQRYLRDNKYAYGIFVQKYKWYLIKDNNIIEEIDFNKEINVEVFSKFICWDN